MPSLVPVVETSWEEWRNEYPATLVVSGFTGYNRDYRVYPYGSYDQLDNDGLLFNQPDVDRSRPIKERVLGVRTSDDGGKGYPFLELADLGPRAAVNDMVGGTALVVLYDAANGATAAAYHARADGQPVSFEVVDDQFQDLETGSTWNVFGRAVSGPLEGAALEPLENAYVSFWFAWRFFQRDADIFLAE